MTSLVAILITITTHAQIKLNFEIAGKTTDFYQYDNMRLMSNIKCDKANSGVLCKEFDFLKTLKNKNIKLNKDSLTGAAGSDACTIGLNGIIVLGYNKISKSQNTFCKIDNLLVDIGTITYYRLNGE